MKGGSHCLKGKKDSIVLEQKYIPSLHEIMTNILRKKYSLGYDRDTIFLSNSYMLYINE